MADAPLPRGFYARPTLQVARELLGARLVRREADGGRTSGIIIETEAYVGRDDLGCHARAGRTQRNAVMWGPPGHAYVYFTYGMHWMLNVVTERQGFPAAVLLRAIHPLESIERMQARRAGRPLPSLADGPAKLCQALAIDGSFNGLDLCQPSSPLTIEPGLQIPHPLVTRGPRVGLNNVPEPWKSIHWRFQVSPQDLLPLLREEP